MMMSTRILSLLVFTSTHYFKVLSFGLQKSSSFAGIHRSLVTRTIPSMNSDSHQSSSVVPVLSPDEQVILDKFRSHQEKAPRLSFAEEVRTLIDQSIGFGSLIDILIASNQCTCDRCPLDQFCAIQWFPYWICCWLQRR